MPSIWITRRASCHGSQATWMMDELTAVRLYSDLIDAFVSGTINADAFEQRYLGLRRGVAGEGVYPSGEVGEVLDDLFGDVDAYTTLEPRQMDELDAFGLLAAA